MTCISRALLLPVALSALLLSVNGQSTQPARIPEKDLLTQAIEMNTAEVSLAKVAAGKTQNSEVKSFADMMVKDHTEALTKLHTIPGAPADVKPNTAHQAAADRLSKLSGPEFDRQYINAMVSDHQKALTFFEQQSNRDSGSTATETTSLPKVSVDLVPTVRQHLQQAQKIQKNLASKSSSN